jgi:outer membrane protein TolC
MRIRLHACVAASLAFGALAAQPLTIEEAANIAKKNAFDVLTALEERNKAAAVVGEARGAMFPKLDFSGVYTRYTDEVTVVFDPNQPPIVVRPIDQTTLRLSLTQNVDLWGIARLAWAGVRALKLASDAMVVAAINNAALRARTAFTAVLKAQEIHDVAVEKVTNVGKQLATATKKYEAGTAPKYDIIRFETDLKGAEQEVILAANGVDTAKASFNEALARNIDTPVELVKPGGTPAVSASLEQLTEESKKVRPDILAAKRRYEYQRNYSAARAKANLPTLDLGGTLSYDPNAGGFGAQKQSVFGTATLSFPIFDRGQNKSRLQQARADEAKAKIALDQTTLAVEREVRQAYLNLEASRRAVDTAQKGVELAAETLRLANLRYDAEVGTTLEVSNANLQLAQARTNYINAQYAYWDALANLQRAVGKEDLNS